MITDHVYSVRVPPDHATTRVAAAVPARGDVEDRRNLDPAPPAPRPTTAAAAPPETQLGGPGHARRLAQRDTESAPPRAAGCWSLQKRSCAGTATSSAAAGRPGPRAAGPASQPPAGPSRLWFSGWPGRTPRLPADPRGTGRPGSQDRGLDRMGDPQDQRHRPAPRRTGPAWSQFLRSQDEAILACDFFSVDLLDGTQAYVLAVIEYATRRIRILGLTLHPTGAWTAQQARNLLMDLGEQTHQIKFMIRDRGSNFTTGWRARSRSCAGSYRGRVRCIGRAPGYRGGGREEP